MPIQLDGESLRAPMATLAVAARLAETAHAERVAKLHAGAAAEAQAETGPAIREVGGAVRVGGKPTGAPRGLRVPGNREPSPPVAAEDRNGIGQSVERFYAEALLQSRVWFLASVVAAFIGLAVIVWEVIQATNNPTLGAVIKTVSGLLTGAIAALFYRQSNTTRKAAADLLTSTQSDRRAETARQLLSTIKDDDRREEITARLVMHLAGAAPMSRSATTREGGSGSRRTAMWHSSAAPAAGESDGEGSE